MENKLMVSAVMITYKQEAFIAEAIEGVLMQIVDFPVELIIADDCSPDSTQNIVKHIIDNHPNGKWIKYFRHDSNFGMQKNGIFAINKCQGKYIAVCEGDDYWIDPSKLQKQVDYLEKNIECVYSFTNYKILKSDNLLYSSNYLLNSIPTEMDLHKLLLLNVMPGSLTVIFRRKHLPKNLPSWYYMAFNGDWCLLFIITQKGMIHFLDESTAIYREGIGVISNTNNLIKFKNGLKSNKELNKYTNYQYDYHIGNYLFHYKNITYSYLENKKKVIGLMWFLKTNFYCVFSKKTVWKQSNMFVFFKSVIKLFLFG